MPVNFKDLTILYTDISICPFFRGMSTGIINIVDLQRLRYEPGGIKMFKLIICFIAGIGAGLGTRFIR